MVACIAEMDLRWGGIQVMAAWVNDRRPECLPEIPEHPTGGGLFPHDLMDASGNTPLTHNELLVELAGRKCYNSFGAKAGRKTNAEYLANMLSGPVPHASVFYHAKMTFFIGGISRRLSHELIRHYVGADRDEEGSPSQESTRFVKHTGHMVVPPAIIEDTRELDFFTEDCQLQYGLYCSYIKRHEAIYFGRNNEEPKGLARKRIYEAASALLPQAAETSFIWTTNPMALRKMFKERSHESADLEFQRLITVWSRLCTQRWPSFFAEET